MLLWRMTLLFLPLDAVAEHPVLYIAQAARPGTPGCRRPRSGGASDPPSIPQRRIEGRVDIFRARARVGCSGKGEHPRDVRASASSRELTPGRDQCADGSGRGSILAVE